MSSQLSTILEKIAEIREMKSGVEEKLKQFNKELGELESLAVELMASQGLELVRAGGRSWFPREFFSVSVPEENKRAVADIARQKCPELLGVNTTTLKSWLLDHRREGDGGETSESLAAGTPFDGLVREYREVKLSSRVVGG
jgi:hypothetical protein